MKNIIDEDRNIRGEYIMDDIKQYLDENYKKHENKNIAKIIIVGDVNDADYITKINEFDLDVKKNDFMECIKFLKINAERLFSYEPLEDRDGEVEQEFLESIPWDLTFPGDEYGHAHTIKSIMVHYDNYTYELTGGNI